MSTSQDQVEKSWADIEDSESEHESETEPSRIRIEEHALPPQPPSADCWQSFKQHSDDSRAAGRRVQRHDNRDNWQNVWKSAAPPVVAQAQRRKPAGPAPVESVRARPGTAYGSSTRESRPRPKVAIAAILGELTAAPPSSRNESIFGTGKPREESKRSPTASHGSPPPPPPPPPQDFTQQQQPLSPQPKSIAVPQQTTQHGQQPSRQQPIPTMRVVPSRSARTPSVSSSIEPHLFSAASSAVPQEFYEAQKAGPMYAYVGQYPAPVVYIKPQVYPNGYPQYPHHIEVPYNIPHVPLPPPPPPQPYQPPPQKHPQQPKQNSQQQPQQHALHQQSQHHQTVLPSKAEPPQRVDEKRKTRHRLSNKPVACSNSTAPVPSRGTSDGSHDATAPTLRSGSGISVGSTQPQRQQHDVSPPAHTNSGTSSNRESNQNNPHRSHQRSRKDHHHHHHQQQQPQQSQQQGNKQSTKPGESFGKRNSGGRGGNSSNNVSGNNNRVDRRGHRSSATPSTRKESSAVLSTNKYAVLMEDD